MRWVRALESSTSHLKAFKEVSPLENSQLEWRTVLQRQWSTTATKENVPSNVENFLNRNSGRALVEYWLIERDMKKVGGKVQFLCKTFQFQFLFYCQVFAFLLLIYRNDMCRIVFLEVYSLRWSTSLRFMMRIILLFIGIGSID